MQTIKSRTKKKQKAALTKPPVQTQGRFAPLRGAPGPSAPPHP
jgi:hypothetical protein